GGGAGAGLTARAGGVMGAAALLTIPLTVAAPDRLAFRSARNWMLFRLAVVVRLAPALRVASRVAVTKMVSPVEVTGAARNTPSPAASPVEDSCTAPVKETAPLTCSGL